ncbi:hypothetical protein AGMMS49992_09040 [Clostridia bacterium]|nr:hypothetical protein AGMMS49992_09040 [Clostridia bacterium]
MYTRYRLAVTDVLDTMSSYVISNTVRRTTVPNTPVVTAPISNSSTYNVNPRFLLATGGTPDGRTQSLRVKVSSADWVDSATNPDRYSVSGLLVNGVSSIYQMDTLTQGTRVAQIRSFDPASNRESANKNVAFTILASPFSIITAKQRVKATDILTIRTAVNVVRKYYGLPLVVWAEPVVAWLCQIKNWVFHIKEIRTALDEVVALINSHDAVATFDVPSFVWLPIKTGSPQAAVMNQIHALILSL